MKQLKINYGFDGNPGAIFLSIFVIILITE